MTCPSTQSNLAHRVDLYNGGCWGTSVNLDVYLDGTVIAEDHLDLPGRDYSRSYGHGYGLNCGKTNLDWGYLIDPFTGVTRTDHFCDKYDNYDSNCR